MPARFTKVHVLVMTLALRVFNAAGQIAIALFLLKAYDKAAVGFFSVFVSNTMLCSLLSRQGFDRTLILFAVRPRASSCVHALFVTYARRVLLVAPIAGVFNIGAFYISSNVFPSIEMGAILFLLPTVLAISFLASGHFTGFGKTVSATLQQPGFSSGITAIILMICFAYDTKPDVFITYFLISTAIAFVGFYRVLKSSGNTLSSVFRACVTIKKSILHTASGYSRRYFVINFFTTFSSVYFISFLALFVTDSLIGEFKVVERLAMVIAFNLSFINIILPGNAIRQHHAGAYSGFSRAIRMTFLFQYVTGGGIFITLLLFRAPIMAWLEIDSATLYVLLIVAQLVNALTGPVRVLLMYLGGQKILQISAILETLGSAVLYWFLYNAYGLTGLAIAYFVAITTPNIILACIVFYRHGIVPLPFVSPKKRLGEC